MKNDSSYQNYPQNNNKHLDKHNKKIHKVLREKSSSLYLLPVNCEGNSTNTEILVPKIFHYLLLKPSGQQKLVQIVPMSV